MQHQKFSPRHSGVLKSSSDSKCREDFNYKYPHPCTPGKDCLFVVKWQPLEALDEEARERQKWVEFEVTADLTGLDSASFWVALGFSSNSAMVSMSSLLAHLRYQEETLVSLLAPCTCHHLLYAPVQGAKQLHYSIF